jgi:hypothetical protein
LSRYHTRPIVKPDDDPAAGPTGAQLHPPPPPNTHTHNRTSVGRARESALAIPSSSVMRVGGHSSIAKSLY